MQAFWEWSAMLLKTSAGDSKILSMKFQKDLTKEMLNTFSCLLVWKINLASYCSKKQQKIVVLKIITYMCCSQNCNSVYDLMSAFITDIVAILMCCLMLAVGVWRICWWSVWETLKKGHTCTHSPHSTAPSLMAVFSTPCDWRLCAPHKVHLITRQEHIRAGHI